MTHVKAKNSKIHLCNLCDDDFARCKGNVVFGEAIGDDNVIECDEFDGDVDDQLITTVEDGEHSAH